MISNSPGSPVSPSRIKVKKMIAEFQGGQDSFYCLTRSFVEQVIISLSKASTVPTSGSHPSSAAAATGRKNQSSLNDKRPLNSQLPSGGQLSSNEQAPPRLQADKCDARAPPPDPSRPPTPSESQRSFTLTLDDMGKTLAQSLQRFIKDEAFGGIININDLAGILQVPWEELTGRLQLNRAREADTTEMRYSRGDDKASGLSADIGKGWCYLCISKKPPFDIPKYPLDV
ncbi:uncharacterized protein NECHADRAFT_89510 [Fusarium vanettenii 77-13-4]|uniref:Uncharacterized protein n=1 Tax=Fusarium vanettenii (strain ATCC MYA-4622 / CBS 123669 / FGSC 9596 / NRRL 45880 / 77-13-4) TaxID=660122 RepID=C7ZRF1_FUSV7|nr:uncharacterized protein NECHADRAFT_89510 [Fusarium vanettenii 77-13-4]EEU33404.1 predicted protein [Fusarium vanettenii 77-13-4]